jgi:hypothetical protein
MLNVKLGGEQMAYEARVAFEKSISMSHSGIAIHVRRNGGKLGRLLVNKADVKWLPTHKSKRGPDVSWRKLVKLLEEDFSK